MIRLTNLPISQLDELFIGLQLRCVYFHVAEQKDRWSCGSHIHEFLEIGYIYKGTGLYKIGDTEYAAQTGDVFIVPAGVPHYETNSEECPFEIIFLMVLHEGDSSEYLTNKMNSLQGRISVQLHTKVKELFDDIYDEIIIQPPGFLSFIDAKLKSLYILLYRQALAQAEEPVVKPPKLDMEERNKYILWKIRQYTLEHMEENFSIETISKNLYYHPKYLSQIVKKETGRTLSSYIQCLRMEKARELLTQTKLSPREISEQMGFCNVQHFYRLFKNETGLTPINYKNKYSQAPRDPL